MVLQYFASTIFAFLSISQIVEKASLSTSALKEHKFSVKSLGNISVRLLTKYTVVHRLRASKSKAESGFT